MDSEVNRKNGKGCVERGDREEDTWETENKMKADSPEWSKEMGKKELGSDSGTNPIQGGETCSVCDPR